MGNGAGRQENRAPVPSPTGALRALIEGRLPVEEALVRLTRHAGGKALPEAEPSTPHLEEILQELDSLIGLESVKKLIRELQAFIEIQRRRARERLVTEPLVLHMIFKGAPGTGKTTVARLLGRMFKEIGLLPRGHLVEVERADLVGEYIGHTAQKTREQLKRALGGILFIDEAYSLARGGEKDFGKEAIDALVKGMEDFRDQVILILAGYSEEMDFFLATNPGLKSRFPIQITFPDYTAEELLAIAEVFLTQRQYHLSAEARQRLRRYLERAVASGAGRLGNARLVRNLLERALRRQAVRLVKENASQREELMEIIAADLEEGEEE